MKNRKLLIGVALLVGLGANAFAERSHCHRGYMKDPCASNEYSIVESEPFVKGPHNCMAIAHYFPGEEPEGYCGGSRGKNTVRPTSPVIPVGS